MEVEAVSFVEAEGFWWKKLEADSKEYEFLRSWKQKSKFDKFHIRNLNKIIQTIKTFSLSSWKRDALQFYD